MITVILKDKNCVMAIKWQKDDYEMPIRYLRLLRYKYEMTMIWLRDDCEMTLGWLWDEC